jgi:broad specificity phosphatase PhoE
MVDKLSVKERELYFREQNIIQYYDKEFITLVKEKDITNENINEFLFPYLGNDYKKLNKDIDRNVILLEKINNLINNEKMNIDLIKKFIKSNLQKQIKLLDAIINDDNLIIDLPFVPHITHNKQFDIIFVRHGVSCTNVIPKDKKVKYFDPELTRVGIERSIELHSKLMEKINIFWKDQPYAIGASILMRAQETAYYMIAQQTQKPINVIPHIAEKNLSASNIVLSKVKQQEFLMKRNPEIMKSISMGKDGRESQNLFTKSNYELFLDWANQNTDFFEQGSDGVYRSVIFSHGVFLEVIFNGIVPENNDIFHAIINESNYDRPQFEYFKLKPFTDEKDRCPNDCRITFC